MNIILLNLKVLPLRLCQRGGGRLQWMFSKCGHKQSQSVFRSPSLTAEVTTVIIQPTTFHISQNQKPILLLAGCERLRRLLDKIFLWELSNKNPNFQEINKRDFFQWKELITDPLWHENEVNSVKNSQDVISPLSHLPSPSPPSWERREGPAGGRWDSLTVWLAPPQLNFSFVRVGKVLPVYLMGRKWFSVRNWSGKWICHFFYSQKLIVLFFWILSRLEPWIIHHFMKIWHKMNDPIIKHSPL